MASHPVVVACGGYVLRPILLAAGLISCLGAIVTAQPLSGIAGVVREPDGSHVAPDVLVVAEDSTGQQKSITSSERGYFHLPLSPGQYVVSVDLRPQKPFVFVETVTVKEGQTTFLGVRLRFLTDERLTVHGEADTDAPVGSSVAGGVETFSRHAIDTLPLPNGRTLQSLQSLVPGIVFTESTGTLAQFTAAGQRRYANRTTIDGIGADLAIDARAPGIGEAGSGALPALSTLGGTQTLVPLDAIEEVQVRTTNASAEYARTPGAQTAFVTRAGGDRSTGAVFFDTRPSRLEAADWFDNAKGAPKRQVDAWNTGASLGGPLVRGRVFHFSVWEQQQVDRPRYATVQTPSDSVRDSASATARRVLDAFPHATGADLGNGLTQYSAPIPAASALWTFSERVDANLSPRHRMFARFNAGRSHGDAVNDLQLPWFSFGNREATSTNTGTIGLTSLFSSSSHELRVNATAHRGSLDAGTATYGDAQPLPVDLLAAPGTDAWTRVTLFPGPGGFIVAGRSGSSAQAQLQVRDAWTFAGRGHEWRVGFEYRRQIASSKPASARYTYSFASVADLLQGRVRGLRLEDFEPARTHVDTWSAFVQDVVHVSSRLSLNYGVRYTVQPAPSSDTDVEPMLVRYETLPEVHELPRGSRLWNTSWTNIAPQVAATYRLGNRAARDTTLHAGWNVVFDDITRPGASAFGRAFPYASQRVISRPSFPLAVPDRTITPAASFWDSTAAETYAFAQHFPPPRTYAWQVGVDQSLGPQRLGLAYVGTAGRKLAYWHVYEVGDDAHLVQAYSAEGRSDYHALLVEFVRHLSRGLEGRLAYTWSHAIDTDSGETDLPNPPPSRVAPLTNRASADFDRRHNLRLTASYQPPSSRLPGALRGLLGHWQADVLAAVTSGAPVTIAAPRDVGFGTYAFRPDPVSGVPVWGDDPASPTGRAINPAAFMVPTDRQGTLGRNTLRASPLRQIDLGLSRVIRLGDRVTARVRLDVFNALNTPNVGPPIGDLTKPGFGVPRQSYAEALGTGSLTGGGLMPTQQVGGPRAVQVGLRLKW